MVKWSVGNWSDRGCRPSRSTPKRKSRAGTPLPPAPDAGLRIGPWNVWHSRAEPASAPPTRPREFLPAGARYGIIAIARSRPSRGPCLTRLPSTFAARADRSRNGGPSMPTAKLVHAPPRQSSCDSQWPPMIRFLSHRPSGFFSVPSTSAIPSRNVQDPPSHRPVEFFADARASALWTPPLPDVSVQMSRKGEPHMSRTPLVGRPTPAQAYARTSLIPLKKARAARSFAQDTAAAGLGFVRRTGRLRCS